MSEYNIIQIVNALASKTKRERKEAFEQLQYFLSQDDVGIILHSTKGENNVSWNELYKAVHNAILEEAEKENSKQINSASKNLEMMLSVILDIFDKSVVGGVPLLECDTVVNSTLSVFQSESKTLHLGSTYTGVLTKYILGQRKHWGEIKAEQWMKMRDLCKFCFKKPPPRTQCVIYLDALADVIRLSCKNVLISHNFLDVFPFVTSIISNYDIALPMYGVPLLKLINVLCLQLAVEFRYKVCSFMENVFNFVLSLHDRKKSSKNTLIYHFLTIYLSVHNPNGVSDKSASFYAYNHSKWKSQIKTIFSLTQDNAKVLLKNPAKAAAQEGFMDLFVDINYLIFVCGFHQFESSNTVDSEYYCDSSAFHLKRKHSNSSFSESYSLHESGNKCKKPKRDESFLHVMKDLQSSDTVFWLVFLESLLQKYPQILKTEFKNFAQHLSKLLHDCRDAKTARAVCRCLHIILSQEKNFIGEHGVAEKELNDLWRKVRDEILRLFVIEESAEYHKLLRAIIVKFKYWEPLPLINLYVNGIIGKNDESLLTLLTVSQHCELVDSFTGFKSMGDKRCGQVRLYFLNWLFQDYIKYTTKELSKTLIALILTRSEEECTIPLVENTETVVISRNINDFCKFITATYEKVDLKNLKFREEFKKKDYSVSGKIDVKMEVELHICLTNRFEQLQEKLMNKELSMDEQLKAVRDSLHFCELILNLCTCFKNLNIQPNGWNDLMQQLNKILMLSYRSSRKLLENDYFSLSPFINLYSSTYHMDICKVLRQNDHTCLPFIEYLFIMFEDRGKIILSEDKDKDEFVFEPDCDGAINNEFSKMINNPNSVLHINSLTGEEKKLIEIIEVICSYVIIHGCFHSSTYQTVFAEKIFQEISKKDIQSCSTNLAVQIILRVTFNFSKYGGLTLSILNKNLKLLTILFNSKKEDSEIAIVILQIMKKYVFLVHRVGDEMSELEFVKLIEQYNDLIHNKKKYGIKMILKYIEFITEIVKINWAIASSFNNKIHDYCREIILFLKHSYYEVRLFASQHVPTIFITSGTNKKEATQSQGKLIKLLKSILEDGSAVKEESVTNVEVLRYNREMEMSTSLITWAGIICLNNCWKRPALVYLCQLVHKAKFDEGKVRKILSTVCSELNIVEEKELVSSHLPFLMQKWAELGFELEEFPYYIIGCGSMMEFLENYSNIIVPIFLKAGQMNITLKIAYELSTTSKNIVNKCYPEIAALALPDLNEENESGTPRHPQKMLEFVEEQLNITFTDLMIPHLDKIIFRMFYFLEDAFFLNDSYDLEDHLIEDYVFKSFTEEKVMEVLGHVKQGEGGSFLEKIALDRPFVIQKVLLLLAGEVSRARVDDDKIISLYKYTTFVFFLSRTIARNTEQPIVAFVVKDVLYTLISFIHTSSNRKIINVALKCLTFLVNNFMKNYSSILEDYLSVIAAVCKPLVRNGFKEALTILRTLICSHVPELKAAISALDVFPDELIFREINFVLKQNKSQWGNVEDAVKHFLDVAGKKRCGVEGLQYLRHMLTDKKKELKKMFVDLHKLRGFSEDCTKSLLHQLVCALIELTHDDDPLIREEAAKCLGELGPLDLTTLILRPENHCEKTAYCESPLLRLLSMCINDLSDLLVNENLEVKNAAVVLTYLLMGTEEGTKIVDAAEPKICQYFWPFRPISGSVVPLVFNPLKMENDENEENLWIPKNNHEVWIKTLVIHLLQSFKDSCNLTEAMIRIVEINWHFAERMIPFILDLIISFKDPMRTEAINRKIGEFFEQCFKCEEKTLLASNLKSIHCIVNMVDHVRIQGINEGMYDRSDLKLNYLHVAEAARRCSAFFTSILYVELWYNEKKKIDASVCIDNLCDLYPEEGFAATKILRDCYSKIGIPDGVHGCGYMHLLDFAQGSQQYEHLNKWDISVVCHDIELSQGSSQSERRLMHSLHRFGLHYTVNNLIQHSSNKHELQDIQFKCASTLSDWNLVDNANSSQGSVNTYEKSRYFALKAFHDDDHTTFISEIERARRDIIQKLSSCSLESVENLYPFLSELRCLKELEDFELAIKSSSKNNNDLILLNNRWRQQDDMEYSDFAFVEAVLTQRITFITEELQRNENKEIKNLLQSMIFKVNCELIKKARREKRFEVALRHLSRIGRMENQPSSILGELRIERSLLEWELGNINVAKFLLCQYLKRDEIKGSLKAEALRINGDWMASVNSGNPRIIIEQYYLKAIQIHRETNTSVVDAYASLAKFADANYEKIKEYLASPLFENKKNIINGQQSLVSGLRLEMRVEGDRDRQNACRMVEKQSAIDENEIKNSEAEKDHFLILAFEYYCKSLKKDEKYDFFVFRLISLWFSNPENEKVTELLKTFLPDIPSYKFLCLLPQILPRIADIRLVSSLTERCVVEHPYHTLPPLFALANSFHDEVYSGTKQSQITPRVIAAKEIIKKFYSVNDMRRYVTDMSLFYSAMIELANTVPEGKSLKPGTIIEIKEQSKIACLNSLSFAPIPSVTIPYSKNCKYDDIYGIARVDNKYELVGGINLPKKIDVIGTDGVRRSLLVKGKDDLRQDAVMQQVFTVMNTLLSSNPETNKRRLVIRTYKVVPLSHRSGIIEWCENTQPMSRYLVGRDQNSGAHRRFHPDDLSPNQCRALLRQAFENKETNEVKFQIFQSICERLRPVFRHFFTETFPHPGVWFERRLAYIRSVATSSMIGYILGLGDRHLNNILIDEITAEVIHIDLGIAFELGRTFRIPETVPFRLTRDIVDGMGISGLEGVFRQSCIKTMEVLRESQRTILTLLEVLLYDPLYAWTIAPEKAQSDSEGESSSDGGSKEVAINKTAQRALIRLRHKLQGMENGGVATNAEGQVDFLIQQAQDPNNLSRMFHGWQPHL